MKKRVRADRGWVATQAKEQEKNNLKRLKVMANPCSVKRRGKLHLERLNAGVSIRLTPVVERICLLAKEPIVYEKLEEALIEEYQEEQKVKKCLEQVFNEGYLISELSPRLNQPPDGSRFFGL